MNKLNAAVDRIRELERERDRALDALEGMVEQHCYGQGLQPGIVKADGLAANERAFDVLVDAGRMEQVRGVFYRLVEVKHEA